MFKKGDKVKRIKCFGRFEQKGYDKNKIYTVEYMMSDKLFKAKERIEEPHIFNAECFELVESNGIKVGDTVMVTKDYYDLRTGMIGVVLDISSIYTGTHQIITINGIKQRIPLENIEKIEVEVNDIKIKEEKKEDIIMSNKVKLPVRVIFQYAENTGKGATILYWSDAKDDKTVVKLTSEDKFDKTIGFLWAFMLKYSGFSRTKLNTMISFVRKVYLEDYLKFQFKELTGMPIDKIDKYLAGIVEGGVK